MREIIFEVIQESDGGYCAERLTESLFTQAETSSMAPPDQMHLHLIRDGLGEK